MVPHRMMIKTKIGNALRENYELCKKDYPNNYVYRIPVDTDDIYKSFGTITVEKNE